MLALQNTALLL